MPNRCASRGFFACLVALTFARSARADTPSADNDITVGPSISWGLGAEGETPLILGVEVSYLPMDFLWATLGARVARAERDTTFLHVEAGTWLFAALGVGYSQRITGDGFDANVIQLFIGEPIPFMDAFDAGMLFVEPYYRPSLGLSHTHLQHELGVMLKFTTFQ